ncbi:MAG: hypothetical protein ACQ9ET_03745 [Nitrosomonadaceae bacterium]
MSDNTETTTNIVPPEVVNPLLAGVYMPGETFTLPSGGIFYDNGELVPEVQNGEIHVYPMAAYDEILIRTPDLLFSGEAIKKIFARCIPQVLKPTALFARDIDFLLIALRKVTFGDEMVLNYTHVCDDAKEHTYVAIVSELIQSSVKIDPTTIGSTYALTLPNNQKVELRPARFSDVMGMMQTLGLHENTPEKETEQLIDTIMGIIRSVDGTTKPEFIREWLNIIDAKSIDLLVASIEKTGNWGPTFITNHKCKDCGADITVEAPLNPVSFFT